MEETRREIDLMKALRSCETVVQFLDSQVVERGHEFGWVILILMERLVPFRDRMATGTLTVQDATWGGTSPWPWRPAPDWASFTGTSSPTTCFTTPGRTAISWGISA